MGKRSTRTIPPIDGGASATPTAMCSSCMTARPTACVWPCWATTVSSSRPATCARATNAATALMKHQFGTAAITVGASRRQQCRHWDAALSHFVVGGHTPVTPGMKGPACCITNNQPCSVGHLLGCRSVLVVYPEDALGRRQLRRRALRIKNVGDVDCDSNECRFDPGLTLAPGGYVWRIEAINDCGMSGAADTNSSSKARAQRRKHATKTSCGAPLPVGSLDG